MIVTLHKSQFQHTNSIIKIQEVNRILPNPNQCNRILSNPHPRTTIKDIIPTYHSVYHIKNTIENLEIIKIKDKEEDDES